MCVVYPQQFEFFYKKHMRLLRQSYLYLFCAFECGKTLCFLSIYHFLNCLWTFLKFSALKMHFPK